MKPEKRPESLAADLAQPEVFEAREHALTMSRLPDGRWSVSVDGRPIPGTYSTRGDAWEAGVQAADLLDRKPAPSLSS